MRKVKTIWLINQYAMPPEYESRLRTIKFAQYLSEAGYCVKIFASSVMHNFNINLIEDHSQYIERSYGNVDFVHINTPLYKNSKLKRIYSSIVFALRTIRISKNFNPPDIILQTATVPFGNILYYLAKRTKAQYIVEVLDLWPESFAEVGLLNRESLLMKFAYWTERWLYKRADDLIFSMEGGMQYIKDKQWDNEHGGPINLSKIWYLNNGVDLDDFSRNVKDCIFSSKLLMDPTIRRVIYVGSIRLANNVKQLVDAAQELLYLKDVKFLIYGDGSDREYLESYCDKNNIDNVVFCEKWVHPKYIPYILSCSTVNILNYKPQGFGHYGGSQSKMFQYMASGKPICCNIEMMYCLIKKYNLGIAKEFKTSKEYAYAIASLLNLPHEKYNIISHNNRKTAHLFDYKFLTQQLITVFR